MENAGAAGSDNGAAAADTNEDNEEREAGLETNLRPAVLASGAARPGAVILDLNGEVDLSTVPVLRSALSEAADRSGSSDDAPGDIIVNMAGVDYMDSSGYGALLGANKQMRPRGGRIHLAGCNASIVRMLEITRLDALFLLHDSEQAAIASLAAGDPAPTDEPPSR